MTWYRYENYGTALQAVALYKTIEKLGYTPDLIRYRPRGVVDSYSPMPLREMAAKAILKIRGGNPNPYHSDARDKLFRSFVEGLTTESPDANSFPELRALDGAYSAFVCGSDQVWSPTCFDANYFLPFVSDGRRRIAYAPSFGVERIVDPVIRGRMSALITDVGHLSSRETQGAAIVRELSGRECMLVLDPTLLLTRVGWEALLPSGTCEGGTVPEGGYVLCYFLGPPERYERAVSAQVKSLGLSLVTIPTREGQEGPSNCEIGPAEFVRLFAGASYVCTDSFHGIAFATNFGVPFTAYERFDDADPRSQNSRVTSFLSVMGLGSRLSSPEGRPLSQECDFSGARLTLGRMRGESARYLADSLAEAAASRPARKHDVGSEVAGLCCGCGACAAVCPRDAIRIVEDADGFQRCEVDCDACISCGTCLKVCPMSEVTARQMNSALGLFSYKSADVQALKRSSSGGFGHDASRALAETGRHVFACAYDPSSDSARHIEAGDDLSAFQGSKYIQSRSAEGLALAAAGEGEVAFFGTPCQIAGLDSLLRRRGLRDRAVLVDLICHGVPSALLWRRYLGDRRRDGVGEHPEVFFRWKADGWSPLKMMMMSSSKDYSAVESKDDFYAFFSRSLCYARSCYECPYRERSAADVRMGDYWGPRFAEDGEGVSMVVALTDAGLSLVGGLRKGGAVVSEQDLGEYWSVQYPYNRGLPLQWDAILSDLKDGGVPLHELRKRHCGAYDQRARIDAAKGILKRVLRRFGQ